MTAPTNDALREVAVTHLPPFVQPSTAEFRAAEQIVNSHPVISAYTACEWDELDDDGKVWIAAIVRQARLASTVQQPGAGWQRMAAPPSVGGHYAVGGYVSDGILPRRFERAFATCILTLDGPSWSHCDDRKAHVPLEYWQDLGAHPELALSTPASTEVPVGGEGCPASPDHADIMETIENASDDWQKKGYTSALAEVRDMANVGRALLEQLPEGYSYNDCPTEIVTDLQNERDDAVRALAPREAPVGGADERLAEIRSHAFLAGYREGQADAPEDEAAVSLSMYHMGMEVVDRATPPDGESALREAEQHPVSNGSPPEPVSHPSEAWCEAYAAWYEGRRAYHG